MRRQSSRGLKRRQTSRITNSLVSGGGGLGGSVGEARITAQDEPSVHEMRARSSLQTASNQQAAAQHAEAHGWGRGKGGAVAEGSGRRSGFRKAGKFHQSQKERKRCRDVLGGGSRGGRRREGRSRRFGLGGRCIATAVDGGRSAARGAGFIHDDSADCGSRGSHCRRQRARWQDQREEQKDGGQRFHGEFLQETLRRMAGLGKIFLKMRRCCGSYSSWNFAIPSSAGVACKP